MVAVQGREQKQDLPARRGCQGTTGLEVDPATSPVPWPLPLLLVLAMAPRLSHPRIVHRDPAVTAGAALHPLHTPA